MATYNIRFSHKFTVAFFITMCVTLNTCTAGKELNITYAVSPHWHMRFRDRIMPSMDTVEYVKQMTPGEVFTVSINNSVAVPWPSLSPKAVLLLFWCKSGYDNKIFLQNINQGFIGHYFKFLTLLRISSCIIDSLSPNSFKGLTRLETLNIQSKYLLRIPVDLFRPLKNIIWIKMDECNIESITSDLFCDNPKLTFVSFYNNNIKRIESGNMKNGSCKTGALNSFVLEGNNIGDLTNVNFETYKLHGIFSLANSSIYAISRKPFDSLTDVLTIDLKHNLIRVLPDYAFMSLNSTLKYMNFAFNQINEVDISKTFRGLKLETLILSDNNISKIQGSFSELRFLEQLHLQNNTLKQATKETFSNLTQLIRLELNDNKIELIERDTFYNLTNLIKLHIENNKIKSLPKGIFDDLVALSRLYVHSNDLIYLDERTFEKCENLEWLELHDNKLSNISRLVFTSLKLRFIKIEYNKFSAVPVLMMAGLERDCYSFPNLKQLKARHNNISSFNVTCYEHLNNLDLSYNILENISNFGALTKVEKLFMRSNLIRTLPVYAMQGLCTNLIMADFGSNLIETVNAKVLTNCKKLEILKLDKNLLKVFSPLHQTSFRDLRLSSNPLLCDCVNEDLLVWLNSSSTVKIDSATFEDGIPFKSCKLEECKNIHIFDWKELVLKVSLPISFLLLLAGVMAFVIFKFRYEIQVIAFYKWGIKFDCCTAEEDTADNVQLKYDAFVCCAEQDVFFVKDRLIPLLEPKYDICIYYRDFPVGEDIAETILDAIDKSAVVIVIMSEHFINSRWGTFELRNAHYAAIRKKKSRLLIVVLNDSCLRLKMDLTLRSILYTKAYLRVDDKLFKEKLLHSMPEKLYKTEGCVANDGSSERKPNVKFERSCDVYMENIYDTIHI